MNVSFIISAPLLCPYCGVVMVNEKRQKLGEIRLVLVHPNSPCLLSDREFYTPKAALESYD